MSRVFPNEVKSIKDKDWNALLALNEKQQNRVLDRMYTRLCGPDCDPEILEKLKQDKERRYASGRHRGCTSCKHRVRTKIKNSITTFTNTRL